MVEAGGSEERRDGLVAGMKSLSLEERKIVMSPEEKLISKKGDKGQSEFLIDRKKNSPANKKKAKE